MNREKMMRPAILAVIAAMGVGFAGSSTVSAAPANGSSINAAAASSRFETGCRCCRTP